MGIMMRIMTTPQYLWMINQQISDEMFEKKLVVKLEIQEKDFLAKAFRIALSGAGESLILSKSVFAKSGEEVNGKS